MLTMFIVCVTADDLVLLVTRSLVVTTTVDDWCFITILLWKTKTIESKDVHYGDVCHNGYDGISNHQLHRCLLNRLFGCRSKKTSKLRVTGLCAGNSPGTGELSAQRASNAENGSFWWCHHDVSKLCHYWFGWWLAVACFAPSHYQIRTGFSWKHISV